MGNIKKQYRECEECGAPIDSSHTANRLCKRCEAQLSNKRLRDGSKHRPKEQIKKKKKSEEELFENY
jgi:predicted amidophosphoribosyltransferase